MSLYAVEAVDEALDATREFLLPFDAGRWLRLLVVALFVGSGSVVDWLLLLPGRPVPDVGGPAGGVDPLSAAGALAVVVAALTLVALAVGPVLRFVLLDALRTDDLRLRDPFRRQLLRGLRLLGFTAGVGVLLLAALGMLVLALTTGGLSVAQRLPDSVAASVVAILAALLGLFVVLVAAGCAYAFLHFTTAFVAPTMLVADCGAFAAWSRFGAVLRERKGQFVAYLVSRVVLGVAAVLLSGAVLGACLLVAAVAGFAGLSLVATAFGGVTAAVESTAGLAAIGAVGVGAALGYLCLVWLPVRVVALTFLTTYELSVLGGVDERLALLGAGGRPAAGSDAGPASEDATVGAFRFDVARPRDDGDADVYDEARSSVAGNPTANAGDGPADDGFASDEVANDGYEDGPRGTGTVVDDSDVS